MTDNEIIKALECCGRESCFGCPYRGKCHQGNPMITDALDLINRQQAELENSKVENQSLRSAANSLKMHYEESQAEIERLQNILICFMDALGKVRKVDDIDEISLIPLMSELNKQYRAELKAEAYKECLAKVKNYIKTHCNPYGKPDFDYDTSIKILNFIDKLAKEMVGDDNA